MFYFINAITLLDYAIINFLIALRWGILLLKSQYKKSQMFKKINENNLVHELHTVNFLKKFFYSF